jgi:hypothetical protein
MCTTNIQDRLKSPLSSQHSLFLELAKVNYSKEYTKSIIKIGVPTYFKIPCQRREEYSKDSLQIRIKYQD